MAISSGEFNPGIALKAGADFSQGVFTAERKARQYNALRQLFGDAVGPDDNLAQLSANSRANQKLPGELEQQGLVNTGLKQSNAFAELNNPIKLERGRLDNESLTTSNDYDRRTLDTRVKQGEQNVRVGEQKLQKGDTELADAQAERERTAAQGILAAVKTRIANGEDPGKAFDAVAPQVAAMEGVDPGRLRSLRDAFVADPAKTIQSMEDYIGAARPNTALMRGQAAIAQAEAAKTRAANSGKGKVGTDPEATATARSFLRETQANAANVIADIVKDAPDVTSNTFMRGVYGKANDYGMGFSEAETRYLNNVESLRTLLGTEALAQRRASGLSFGQITEREFDRIAASVARLQHIRNPEEIAKEAKRIGAMYERLLASEPAAAAAAKGADAPKADPAAPAAPADAERRKALLDKYR